MLAKFSIQADVTASMLRVIVAGFFELPDIAAFLAAHRAEHAKLQCEPNAHVTLVDMREMKIQPQLSVDGFQLIINDPTLVSRRIAFVVEPGLARAQVQRAANGRPARYFATIADAERWLAAERRAVPAAAPLLPPRRIAARLSIA